MEERFIITKKLAETVLNYLATRPYLEVAGIISELQTIQPMIEAATEQEKSE